MRDITPIRRGFITSINYRYEMNLEFNNEVLLEKIKQTNFSKYLSSAGVLKKGTPNEVRKLWFLNKCIEKFGLDTFNYLEVDFCNTKEPIHIKCKEHGEFTILPNNFLNNVKGCPKCGYKYREVHK